MTHMGPTSLIFAGLFVLGIGRTMPFSLGLPLIDDNVKKRNLPLYFGRYLLILILYLFPFAAGMFLVRMIGPVLGLMMGTVLQKYYYKFESKL